MTAMITNLALIHLPFNPFKPTGNTWCARLQWPRFFTNMETVMRSFDPLGKTKPIGEIGDMTNWLKILQIIPSQSQYHYLSKDVRSCHYLQGVLYLHPSSALTRCLSTALWKEVWVADGLHETPVNNNEPNWHMLLKTVRFPCFCLECMCKSM